MSDQESNKSLCRQFFAALGSYDQAGLEEILSDDMRFNVPGTASIPGQFSGDQLPLILKLLSALCPAGIRFDIRQLTAEDNRVSCMVDGHGLLADGGEYNNYYHFLIEIENGKIRATHEYMDTLLVEKLFKPLLAAMEAEQNAD